MAEIPDRVIGMRYPDDRNIVTYILCLFSPSTRSILEIGISRAMMCARWSAPTMVMRESNLLHIKQRGSIDSFELAEAGFYDRGSATADRD